MKLIFHATVVTISHDIVHHLKKTPNEYTFWYLLQKKMFYIVNLSNDVQFV